MKSRDFVYWLQGFFELADNNVGLSAQQVTAVKNHLNLVFKHEIDPAMGGAKTQAELNHLHSPNNPNVILRC